MLGYLDLSCLTVFRVARCVIPNDVRAGRFVLPYGFRVARPSGFRGTRLVMPYSVREARLFNIMAI